MEFISAVLMAYAGRDNENAAPFITLNNSAGVNGLSIWYPEQSPADIRPYPPAIGNGGGATVYRRKGNEKYLQRNENFALLAH